jgi:hypothetical protein
MMTEMLRHIHFLTVFEQSLSEEMGSIGRSFNDSVALVVAMTNIRFSLRSSTICLASVGTFENQSRVDSEGWKERVENKMAR